MELKKYLININKVKVLTKKGLIFKGKFVFSDYEEEILVQDNNIDYSKIKYKNIKKLYVEVKFLFFKRMEEIYGIK